MEAAETWKRALDEYRYPVDLSKFVDARQTHRWFYWDLDIGNRHQTIEFETRFRENAPYHLEAWAEVVFWKLYTTRAPARDDQARRLLDSLAPPGELWEACTNYITNPNKEAFSVFRNKLFRHPVVATAATFPTFIRPELFPMVDRQVTNWARSNGFRHRYAEVGGPNLVSVPALGPSVLQELHWAFIESWMAWCQFTARILSQRTGWAWRARDVEMAVFTAQRSGLQLEPLS